MEGKVELSVVIPVFNEAGNLPELYERLARTLDRLKHGSSDEVIFVDDGSNDGSDKILRQLHERDPRVKVIRFSQNFGQHAALSAGIERARGRIVVIMDGDLQYDPQDIQKLLEKMEEGHDVVTGWREGREDGLLTRRLPSYLANRLIGGVTGIHLHDYNCGLKAFTADVAKRLSQYGEMRRFLGALLVLMGRSIAEVRESQLEMTWRALQAPFTIPVRMAEALSPGARPSLFRLIQSALLAFFLWGRLWVLLFCVRRWYRGGAFPRSEGLLLLWLVIPVLTLTLKKQALMWYYFDLLYPSQFLVIGLAVDGFLQAVERKGIPRSLQRGIGFATTLGIAFVVFVQASFLEALRQDVLSSGALRLPTEIGLRFPDPLWWIRTHFKTLLRVSMAQAK